MKILFIGDNYVLKGLRGNMLYLVEYLVKNIPKTKLVYADDFNRKILEEFCPNIIYFVHVGSMNKPNLFEMCRNLNIPLCLMSIDLFRVRDIIKTETFMKLDAMLGPVKCKKMYEEYKNANPKLIIKNFSSRFVNTKIFYQKNVEKIFDILYFGSNNVELPAILSNISEEYYKTRNFPENGVENFYPFRKRIYELLIKNRNRYTIKIIEPCDEASAPIRDENLSTLLNQSYLAVATCSRSDYLFCKHLEIPASNCVIIGTCPSDYENLYEDNYIKLHDKMEDDEILIKIDESLSDKGKLLEKSILFGEKIRQECNYEQALKEFIQISIEILNEYNTSKTLHDKNQMPNHEIDYMKYITKLCDKIGIKQDTLFESVRASDENLKLLYISMKILIHMEQFYRNECGVDIIEIQDQFSEHCASILLKISPIFNVKIKSYTIFCENHASPRENISVRVYEENNDDIWNNIRPNSFCVSNHCLSNMQFGIRETYIQKLFCNISHGFLLWENGQSTSPVSHNICKYKYYISHPVIPNTGPHLEVKF